MPNCRRALYKGMRISLDSEYHERKARKARMNMFEIQKPVIQSTAVPESKPIPKRQTVQPQQPAVILVQHDTTLSFN